MEKKDLKVIGFREGVGHYYFEGDGLKQETLEIERGSGESALRFSAVSRHLRWLQGEILTVLEATIDDDRKLNATKEIVKDKFGAKISRIYELCGLPIDEDEQASLDDQ